MQKRLTRTWIYLPGLMIPAAALAAPQPGEVDRASYAGAAVTQARYDDNNFSIDDLDDEDTSWKLIAGYRFLPQFAVEANYIDFGEATAAQSVPGVGRFAAEAKGYAAYAIGYVPVPYVDFFAKAGMARIDAEGTGGGINVDDETTEFAYGGGVQGRYRNLGLRLEYEKFDTDVIGDLDLISLGATWTFNWRQ